MSNGHCPCPRILIYIASGIRYKSVKNMFNFLMMQYFWDTLYGQHRHIYTVQARSGSSLPHPISRDTWIDGSKPMIQSTQPLTGLWQYGTAIVQTQQRLLTQHMHNPSYRQRRQNQPKGKLVQEFTWPLLTLIFFFLLLCALLFTHVGGYPGIRFLWDLI